MREIGNRYEDIACDYLMKQGYKIVDRNYFIKGGEIDIIAYDKNTLSFIEVKARRQKIFGSPLDSVNKAKQKRIIKSALFYLKEKDIKPENIRFDVLSISDMDDKTEIELIKNAFLTDGYFI